jgi:hypothetical protein
MGLGQTGGDTDQGGELVDGRVVEEDGATIIHETIVSMRRGRPLRALLE